MKLFLPEISLIHKTGKHEDHSEPAGRRNSSPFTGIYSYNDLTFLQDAGSRTVPYIYSLKSLDELIERDTQREKDGFPRKIRIARLVKPGREKKEKVVIVPTTVEEKFYHDLSASPEEQEGTGSGKGEEGDIIAEESLHEAEGSGGNAGQGEGGEHEIESNAYDLGRIITEKFELPNLMNKGKKMSLNRFTYDLTDRNEGSGQLLDKKATLKKIIKTNINLDNIPDFTDIDLTRLLVSPADSVYRILSREKDLEAQAVVFFIRDYSGSMTGKLTELVTAQHILIYSWLMYQYDRQVVTRFILHDTEAKEVPDFGTYCSLKVAGGTRMESAYRLVNKIIKEESLKKDNNIYVFHGTDGDDVDIEGKSTMEQLRLIIQYCSRIGITLVMGEYAAPTSIAERYIRESKVLDECPRQIKVDIMPASSQETRIIEGIKKLIS